MNVEIKPPGRDLSNPYGLTDKEKEVLKLLIHGYKIPAIAEMLNKSPETIRDRRNSILKKTGAKNTQHLCYLSAKLNIVD